MNVIILNGASSSGKSSIAKALQEVLPDNFLHIGIDSFISMMPQKTLNLSTPDIASDGFYWRSVETAQGSVLRIQSGQFGAQINRAYHSTVRHLVDSGLKVIVDDVMDGGREQREWLEALEGIETIFIAVRCSDADLCQREKKRSDRINGSALEQNTRVHNDVDYAFEVSTTQFTALECARQIAAHISR